MPTMPLKTLFKRKRGKKSSFRRKELSDEYYPTMDQSKHEAQYSAEKDTLLDTKEQSRSRFEAARSVFNPTSEPRAQESREFSFTPEKISRFQPPVSPGVESGRDGSNSMHKVFPSNSEDSKEIDIDSTMEEEDIDGIWKERTPPSHQRVAWTGSVVSSNKHRPVFQQNQSHDDVSAQSKSSSIAQDEDTTQYDDIDNRDYILESDDESNGADGYPETNGAQDQHPSNGFVNFGDSYFRGASNVQQNASVFTHEPKREKISQRVKATVPLREAAQPRIGKQEGNINSAPLATTPSMDSYLMRGTESGSFLLGEDLAPSASEDSLAEETTLSEHMSTNNSLIDNSLIDGQGAESRQPESRTDYSPSQFQNDFVNTVRQGWNYLEHNLDQNGLPIQQTVREGLNYLEHNFPNKSTDTELDQDGNSRSGGDLTKTVREGWSYLEHGLASKSVDSEFDEVMMTFRQSWSYMTDNPTSHDERSLPSKNLLADPDLTSRQDRLLNNVLHNMSFFNEDSTDEEVEPEINLAPTAVVSNTRDVSVHAQKDPDELLDDVLENWSLTSDNPTDLNEQQLVKEETNEEPKPTNESAFIATVRQTLSYLTDDEDNGEKKEESNEVQESANENGLMSTLRQTLSYVTDNGEDDEDNDESLLTGSNSVDERNHKEKEASSIGKSWSFLSGKSRDDYDSASDASSYGTASDDESAVYADEMSDEYSDAPSDEGDEGLSVGGKSVGEGGMLDEVLDNWTYFAKAVGIPEDFDGYDTVDSDASPVVAERSTRRRRKSSSKKRRGKKSSKSRNRRRKRRSSVPSTVFGSGDESDDVSVSQYKASSAIVVNISLQPMITHTTEQVVGQRTTDEANGEDGVAQDHEKPIGGEQVTSDNQDEESKAQPFDEVTPSPEKSLESKKDEEEVVKGTVDGDSVMIARITPDDNSGNTAEDDSGNTEDGDSVMIARITPDDKEGESAREEDETPPNEEEKESPGTDGVTGPVLVDSDLLDVPAEYGKMGADEDSIESLGCATATENVSVQSIEHADTEVFDADDLSVDDMVDQPDVEKAENSDGDESAESVETRSESSSAESVGTASESSSVHFDDDGSYSTESDNYSEYDSEYSDEYSDDSSSFGPIKRSYSASSMKSAALERFGRADDSTPGINTVDKVKSKGRSGRVVDCQRSSKRSHRSRKKRTEEESEASQPNRRRLV